MRKGDKMRRVAVAAAVAFLLGAELCPQQTVNSFEQGSDLGDWTDPSSRLVPSTGFVTHLSWNGALSVVSGGGPTTITLDLTVHPGPIRTPGNDLLALDVWGNTWSEQMQLIVIGADACGGTGCASTKTCFDDVGAPASDPYLDDPDMLYFDFTQPGYDVNTPTAIRLIITDQGNPSHVIWLDYLRYTPSCALPQTLTRTATYTHTEVRTPTPTATISPTATVSPVYSPTQTPTHTPTASATRTATESATHTRTASGTATRTRTPLGTRTATPTASPTPTITVTYTPEAQAAVAYPNPLYLDQHDRMIFGQLRVNDEIQIYTVAGEKVRHVKKHEIIDYPGNEGKSVNNIRWGWDGRNDNGEPVISGLYIAVIRHEGGDPDRLKIAIVRP